MFTMYNSLFVQNSTSLYPKFLTTLTDLLKGISNFSKMSERVSTSCFFKLCKSDFTSDTLSNISFIDLALFSTSCTSCLLYLMHLSVKLDHFVVQDGHSLRMFVYPTIEKALWNNLWNCRIHHCSLQKYIDRTLNRQWKLFTSTTTRAVDVWR
jgi:hypothetical protein